MKIFFAASAALALGLPAMAQDEPEDAPSPGQIVDAAPYGSWVRIPSEDLLVMTLAPDVQGDERKVVMQLMPAPFSQGWVSNIRTLARAGWYDNISVNRVQDNYVVQWGDPNYDNPEAEDEAKPLPAGLKVMGEDEYTSFDLVAQKPSWTGRRMALPAPKPISDNYAGGARFWGGWPFAFSLNSEEQPIQIIELSETEDGTLKPRKTVKVPSDEGTLRYWPIHCYGMVGVGRGYSPDTGSGAELYTVIGHAPRHLDRNIALVGRIIDGMEHLSSLPRGSGALGFYNADELEKRTPILSVRVASDLPEAEQPVYEYLSTESATFAKYAEARANRRDPFFIQPAGGADICNIPVPVRPLEITVSVKKRGSH